MRRINLTLTFLLTLSICVFVNGFAFGQTTNGQGQGGNGPQGGMNVDRMVERLDTTLKLTADQKKKIKALYEENFKARQAQQTTTGTQKQTNTTTQPQAGARPNARRERLTQTRETENRGNELDQKIEKVLTPDQVKKFREMRSQRGRGFTPESRVETLNEQLKLTDDQKKKLLTIFQKQTEQFQKMRESAPEGQDRTAMMESFRKIGEESDKEITKILTAEQAKKYAEMQKEMQNRMRGGNRGQQQ